jgi:hypothetical protein
MALPEEIEVVDPSHPLWGRRFRLVSVTGALHTAGFVRVDYRPGILIMLPIPATNLHRHPRPRRTSTKLNVEALEELVATAGESEEACRSIPAASGRRCRRRSAGRSSPSSPRSSGR